MTIIEALNNPKTRELIDQIEEIECDLERGNNPTLSDMKTDLIKELATAGFIWK